MATSNSTTGWPDATNTGVPAGVTLTPSGSLVITQAGAVISGLNITGTVLIEAPNVTLENCSITGATGGGVVQIAQGVTGTTVANCTINGTGANNAGSNGIWGSGTFINNNIFNVENGIAMDTNIQVTSPTLIENNYIHDLQASGSPHYDVIQIDGNVSNVTITHNTLINQNNETSSVMIDNYFGPLSNINVYNNILSGGDFTVYVDGHFNSNPITGVSITNNHMGAGIYGYTDFNGTNPTYTGNVNDAATLISTLNTPANTGGSSTAPAAPAISSWSPDTGVVGDGITDASVLTLKGTAAAGSTVKVYDGSSLIGTVTADSAGAWTDVTPTLTNATHVFTATATTTAGTSAASAAVDVTVDTIAPAAPAVTSDMIVNTNHVQLLGTAEANSTITVYDGTTAVGTGVTNASGSWSVTTSALPTGAHPLTATATDAAGNVSVASQAVDPVIGSSTAPAAPAISSWSPDTGVVGDGITDASVLTLKGTAAAGSTVKVYDGSSLIGTVTADSAGAWTDVTPTLTNATHVFTATATTTAGTSAASAAVDVTVDTIAPAAPAVTSDTIVNTNHVQLSGTAEANSTITVYDGTTAVGTGVTDVSGKWSVTTSALPTGAHPLTATATDAAGNVSVASQAVDPVIGASTNTSSAGWPDATNTGVPAGVTLTASGSLVITKAGAVISGLDISGTVYIDAPNVTLENCKITSASAAVVTIASGMTGAVVQNCEINGTGASSAGSIGIYGSGSFIDNNIYNVAKGVYVSVGSSGAVIENNYIHDLLASGSPGYDGIEIDGGVSKVMISHNTVVNSHGQTSAIMIDNYFGAVSNVSVNNNLLGGGAFTLYDDGHFNSNPITGVSFTNNHLASGQWGYTDFNKTSPAYTGNVNDGATLIATLNTPTNDGGASTAPVASATTAVSSAAPSATTQPASIGFTGLSENSSHVATIAGDAAANSTIKLYDGATPIGATTSDASGQWTFKTGVLSNTVHTFTAHEVDSSGQVVGYSSGEAILGSSRGSVLTSTPGDDYFVGNGHPDTFVFAPKFGQDVIKDFVATGSQHDTIQLSSNEFSDFASVLSHASQVGQDVVISSGSDTLTLKNVKLGALTSHDFHFA